MTQPTVPERILTIDEILDRADRYADDYIKGREIAVDEDLERSIHAHGLSVHEISQQCVRRENNRKRARARRSAP